MMVVAALALFAAPLGAQVITPQMTAKTEMSSEDRQSIRGFVSQTAPKLTDDRFDVRRRARGELLQPLANPSVSVAFRIEYANALVPELHPDHEDHQRRLTSIRIAGTLATQSSTDLLLDTIARDDENDRFMSAHAMELTFVELARPSPAVGPERANQMIDRLARVIREDDNAYVIDAAVRALDGASRIERPRWDANVRAPNAMVDALRERVVALNPGPQDDGVVRAATRAIDLLRRQLIDDVTGAGDIAPRAAELAGHLLSYTASRVRGGIDDDDRTLLAAMVKPAESTIVFAGTALGRDLPDTDLAGMLEDGRDEAFLDGVKDIIGAGGVLSKPPFDGIDVADFLRADPSGDP